MAQQGGGASGGMRSEVQALEAHQHTLFRHLKNEFFSRNLGQNMPENAYFFRKKVVKSPQCRGLHLQTPALLLPLTDIDLSKCVSCVKTILLL